jgi:hypothetical protein
LLSLSLASLLYSATLAFFIGFLFTDAAR